VLRVPVHLARRYRGQTRPGDLLRRGKTPLDQTDKELGCIQADFGPGRTAVLSDQLDRMADLAACLVRLAPERVDRCEHDARAALRNRATASCSHEDVRRVALEGSETDLGEEHLHALALSDHLTAGGIVGVARNRHRLLHSLTDH
jgi:hypothetical protein